MTSSVAHRSAPPMYLTLRASLIGLIVLRLSGLWLLTPPASLLGAVGLTLILVLFIRPVWTADVKSCLWLSFVSTLFFTIGVLNAMTESRVAYGVVESLLAATVFVSAMMFSRYQVQIQASDQAEIA